MKRLGWVVFAIACGQKSPAALPVKTPPPIADEKPLPPPDAAIAVDAGPDPEVVKAQQAADEAAHMAGGHQGCLEEAKRREVELPKLPVATKRKPTAAVFLTEIGGTEERYSKTNGIFAEGPWNGEPLRKKLATKVAAAMTPCYANALKTNPDLSGGVTLGALLNEDGSLTDARVIEAVAGDPTLQTCAKDTLAKIRIPGGSKDAFNFEIYLDLAFCPPDRGACLIGVAGPDGTKEQLQAAVVAELDRMGACFRSAGKFHARGVIEESHHVDPSGTPGISTGTVTPFTGDDKDHNAFAQASDCESTAWGQICLEPHVDNKDDKLSFRRAVRIWFQR